MSQALQCTGGEEAAETSRFVGLVDKFFDSVNVNSLSQGKLKRKVFQNPYRSSEDFRMKVCFTCMIYLWLVACMYVCMYVRMCTYVCMYVCTYVRTRTYDCMYVRTYVCMYVCM